MFQTFCKDEIFINYMQNKVKFLRVKKLENFAGFSFADDQYLFIFAEFNFANLGEIRKHKFRKKISAQISSANNFFP